MSNEIDLTNAWGEPSYYKECPIYPVLMKDIGQFYNSITCLLIPKNSMTDIQIIKMSYLSFLINVSRSEENIHLFEKLLTFLRIVFRTDNVVILVNEKQKYIIRIDEKFDFNERDFDKIRDIVAKQSAIELKDDSLGTEFDKAKAKARENLAKMNKKVADIEQQIFAYRVEQKEPYEAIKNLTIYQFKKEIERIELSKSASILQAAQYSGMVEFKKGTKIPHWLDYINDNNADDDVVLTKEQLDQIARANGLASK